MGFAQPFGVEHHPGLLAHLDSISSPQPLQVTFTEYKGSAFVRLYWAIGATSGFTTMPWQRVGHPSCLASVCTSFLDPT